MNFSQPAAPHLLIDKERCMLNIERMSGKALANSVSFRPHFKTHQSTEVGNWFREYGVKKITVSSLRMAYYFAAHGWQDILVGIAYNPGEHKLYEQLAQNCGLSLTIASAQAAEILASVCSTPLDVMIKLDTGYNRSGIIWDDEKELLKAIKSLKSNKRLNIKGLMTHEGTTYTLDSKHDILNNYRQSVERLRAARQLTGIDDLILSSGDTPSASLVNDFMGIDEIRPGNFVFYDLMQYSIGSCEFSDIALAMICPVIDVRPARGNVVIHGGAVHFSKDSIKKGTGPVYGLLAEYKDNSWGKGTEELYITSLSQEHGIIHCPGSKLLNDAKCGQQIAVIPVHSCLTADCMGDYYITGGGRADHMKKSCQD